MVVAGRGYHCLWHTCCSYFHLLLLFVVILLVVAKSSTNSSHDYCLVGAGPGGLQMGYFLQKAGRDYVIFEKSNISGSFFNFYPRHRKLISINKRHTGKTNKEFNFRHDWNSLISDDESLLMRHYSKDFFPPASTLVKYLNDYSKKLQLKIQYNTEIVKISKSANNKSFTLRDGSNMQHMCSTLIICTGISIPNSPEFPGSHLASGYEDISLDPNDFEGKSVLILGRGNTAFETADHILGSTNVIHMMGRSTVRLSWSTHYVGDLRAVNNGLLDTYQLKSLDGLLEAPVEEIGLSRKDDGRVYVRFSEHEVEAEPGVNHSSTSVKESEAVDPVDLYDNFALREGYDYVIRCLGFKFDFSIFDNATLPEKPKGRRKSKYPKIKYDYEAINVPGMYFAGTNVHSLDHRKSAGGFIHGFRYTSRVLHRILEYRNHGVPWPSVKASVTNLLNHIIKRINECSGNYQMFSVLADIVIIDDNGLEYEYLEEYPVKLLNVLKSISGKKAGSIIVIVFEYGKGFSGVENYVFGDERATGEPSDAHNSNFLHPVLYYYKKLPTTQEMLQVPKQWILPVPTHLHHVVEDFLTLWTAPLSHLLPLRRFLETCLGRDLRNFFSVQCFLLAMTNLNPPPQCQDQYMNGQGLPGTFNLLSHALESGLLF